jgi:recombination protein RecA
MSQALRKLTATIGKSRTVLIFINQIRMKIGVFMGSPETTTGGNALKFYSSVRLDVRKTETINVGGKDTEAIGNAVRVKVVKNKVAPPFRKIEMEIFFGKGVSSIGSLLDCAVKYNVIEKKGAWYNYGEERWQGRDNARTYLEEHPEFARELDEKLRKQIFPGREFPSAKTPDSGKAPGKADGKKAGKAEAEAANAAEADGKTADSGDGKVAAKAAGKAAAKTEAKE